MLPELTGRMNDTVEEDKGALYKGTSYFNDMIMKLILLD